MGLYSGANQWINSIYQFDETDLVQGGPDGIDNKPLKDLADRTTYLNARIGIINRLDGQVDKSGNSSITAADEGKMIVAFGTGVNTLTIANASTLKHGALIPITSYCNPGCVINVVGSGGQQFYDLDGMRNVMYMHHKEHLILVALTNHFKILHASGNFYCAGEEIKARKELRNTLALKGQLLQRNQYPRLWEYVSSLNSGQEVVSESTYFSDFYIYKGFFTTGDGSTTFRLPDERGMFERMIDAGRGVDYGRWSSAAGGYEADDLYSHSHPYRDRYLAENSSIMGSAPYRETMPFNYNNKAGSEGGIDNDNNMWLYYDTNTSYYGGYETRPKNIGKINLIRF